jgi:hypothetical protein
LLWPTCGHLILSYPQGLMPTFIPYRTSVDISYHVVNELLPIPQ